LFLAEALVKSFENVFTDEFLKLLDTEAEPLNKAAESVGTLKHSKRATLWMDIDTDARSGTEVACELLRDVVFGSKENAVKAGVVGMKYWFQHRTGDEHIGFHFDKDEGQASMQQVMRYRHGIRCGLGACICCLCRASVSYHKFAC
jgi:hypothetical protein